MKKTGEIFSRLLLVPLLMVVFASASLAQETDVQASLSENRVFTGEQFTLEIEISGERLSDIETPRLPDVAGLRQIRSTPSRSQSLSIINGVASSVTRYQFTLLAREEGEYTIPSLQITVDGEEHRTDPLTVQVIRHRGASPSSEERRPDIFAEIELDRQNPVVGQQLVASLVVYVRDGVELTSYQPLAGWRTDGFWKEQLENVRQPSAESVLLGGVRYRKATLLRYVLFPSRAGELTLSPFEFHLGVRTQGQRNDPFGTVFRGLGSNQRRITLETDPIRIEVTRPDLPEQGIDIAAVGEFDVERNASVRQVYVGEPIELTTRISGSGNLPLIRRPDFDLPESFERYSPREETDLNRRGTSIEGTRTFTDRFVPRVAGRYTLPEEQVAVYRPSSGSYEYHTLPEIEFEILRDPDLIAAETDRDLELTPITGPASWERPDTGSVFSRFWVWAGLLLPLLLWVVAWKRQSFRQKLEEDQEFARSHHAWDQVEERLLRAEKEAGGDQPKEAYHLMHKAISHYIADRSGLPPAGLSDKQLLDHLMEKDLDRQLIVRIGNRLSKYAGISYAPETDPETILDDIGDCRELLSRLREVL